MEQENNLSPKHHLHLNVDGLLVTGSIHDDRCFKQIGTVWTARAPHITTAVIGVVVLTMTWAMNKIGWVASPAAMLLFSILTYYTSPPLTSLGNSTVCCEGGRKSEICGWVQVHYLNLYGVAIGYIIAASISMMAIKRSYCFHVSIGKNPCDISAKPYMIIFGIAEIIFLQIPGFDLISWISVMAAALSFTDSTIGLGLGFAKLAERMKFGGSLTGISIGTVVQVEKSWKNFEVVGDIALACSYSMICLEIKDTDKCPPSQASSMKMAARTSVVVTTFFYMLYGCMGYAAFGDSAPKNRLSGFGFYNPYWLLDVANVAIVVHLFVAYKVNARPLFTSIEKNAAQTFPNCKIITKEIEVRIPGYEPYNFNLFRLVSRTIFVTVTTAISMIIPFEDMTGLLVALVFCPVYYPLEVYIKQKGTPKWLCFQKLSAVCLVIIIAAAAGLFCVFYLAGLFAVFL